VQPLSVAVAYSGGRDSTALLHATLAAARDTGLHVVALHVHHGLHVEADEWLAHCRATCQRWARRGLPLQFDYRRLDGKPLPRESIEAWARRERYRALGEMAHLHGTSAVLLAHHQRDQAETLLLQALRGAGVAGMAAMPRSVVRDGLVWLRPWLAVSRASIDGYVKRHRLRHIHDQSNDDPRFARNRLRGAVWPALAGAFPEAEASLAMAARWAQEASTILAETARQDLAHVGEGGALRLAAWGRLSDARRSNVLRAWLAEVSGRTAPASLVQRLNEELALKEASRWPIAGGELRRHRGLLQYIAASATPTMPAMQQPLSITRAGRYRIADWPGSLRATRVTEQGLALSQCKALVASARSGGENFQLGPGRPPRALKKQYQSLGIAAWERAGPLLYAGGQLVFVAGLGIDARAWAPPGEPQLALRWVSDEPPGAAG